MKFYSASSLLGFRSAIHRKLVELKRLMNVHSDPAFKDANIALKAFLLKSKKAGRSIVLYCIVLYLFKRILQKQMDAYHGSLPHKYRKKNGEMGERRVEDEAWDEGKQVPKYRGIKAGKKSTREEITSADNSGTFR